MYDGKCCVSADVALNNQHVMDVVREGSLSPVQEGAHTESNRNGTAFTVSMCRDCYTTYKGGDRSPFPVSQGEDQTLSTPMFEHVAVSRRCLSPSVSHYVNGKTDLSKKKVTCLEFSFAHRAVELGTQRKDLSEWSAVFCDAEEH